MNLVADIGGSNIRLALADRDGRLSQPHVAPTPLELAPLLRAYLLRVGAPALHGFAAAAAGPLDEHGGIRMTNHPLYLDVDRLQVASGADRAWLVNDFAALAHAVPALAEDDLRGCGGGVRDPQAPCVVIGAGTGLGVAVGLPRDGGWQVLPGEGGHVDLAPVDARELAVWQSLAHSEPRVSAETVLSGPGLQRIFAVLAPDRPLPSPLAIARAARRGDPVAHEACRLFTRWLGRVAGNLALTLDARGGVFIGGGIVPAWGEGFDLAEFRAGFEDKAPYAARLRQVPAFVIRHPFPALLGLARLASEYGPRPGRTRIAAVG